MFLAACVVGIALGFVLIDIDDDDDDNHGIYA